MQKFSHLIVEDHAYKITNFGVIKNGECLAFLYYRLTAWKVLLLCTHVHFPRPDFMAMLTVVFFEVKMDNGFVWIHLAKLGLDSSSSFIRLQEAPHDILPFLQADASGTAYMRL
ncbi:putative membrane protein [Sesbania bispinosa]|nr:putative membrane protein [Sesbania bispinosa]